MKRKNERSVKREKKIPKEEKGKKGKESLSLCEDQKTQFEVHFHQLH